uniref:Cap-27 n=1 Tax=Haemonchus contortus TaxID=6289 RepID=A0A0K2DSZ7_HAECO|nr:cap-27 [Haemonchus contortus]
MMFLYVFSYIMLVPFCFGRANSSQHNGTKRVLPPQRFRVEVPKNRCGDREIDDTTRDAYLNQHNEYRSILARGGGFNGNLLGYAPEAQNMQKMVYDCTAEKSALRHAKTCSGELSDKSTRPGFKENIIKLFKNYLNDTDVGKHASFRWWKELSLYGVNIEMRFTSEIRYRQTQIVTHFTKMAWHNNVRLGCGHHRCDGFIFAVCHYGPGGNVIGENIYNPGPTCSNCPGNTTCDNKTGLCH